MIIGVEYTSTLQILFSLSILEKKKINIHKSKLNIFIFNKFVTEYSIECLKNELKIIKVKYNLFDLRNKKEISKIINQKYDIFIFRSRIQINYHDAFLFNKKSFINFLNCHNVKKLIFKLKINQIYSVDDGLSNWKNTKKLSLIAIHKLSISFFLSKKISLLPNYFRFFLKSEFFIEHYSVYSEFKNTNIFNSFKSIIYKSTKSIKKNFKVKNLLIASWPNYKNRLTKKYSNDQIKMLEYYIRNFDISNKAKFFIKNHPKYQLSTSKSKHNIEHLSKFYQFLPMEFLFLAFPNLEKIFGIPSTPIFLSHLFLKKKVEINIFIKKDYPKDNTFNALNINLIYGSNIRKVVIK